MYCISQLQKLQQTYASFCFRTFFIQQCLPPSTIRYYVSWKNGYDIIEETTGSLQIRICVYGILKAYCMQARCVEVLRFPSSMPIWFHSHLQEMAQKMGKMYISCLSRFLLWMCCLRYSLHIFIYFLPRLKRMDLQYCIFIWNKRKTEKVQKFKQTFC